MISNMYDKRKSEKEKQIEKKNRSLETKEQEAFKYVKLPIGGEKQKKNNKL